MTLSSVTSLEAGPMAMDLSRSALLCVEATRPRSSVANSSTQHTRTCVHAERHWTQACVHVAMQLNKLVQKITTDTKQTTCAHPHTF